MLLHGSSPPRFGLQQEMQGFFQSDPSWITTVGSWITIQAIEGSGQFNHTAADGQVVTVECRFLHRLIMTRHFHPCQYAAT